MTNTELLRAEIQNAGLKYNFVAEKLNLTPYGLQKKIDNQTEFKASEIYALSEILHFDDAQMKAVFFAKQCD